MGYVVAGYVIVLSLLFLYGLQLTWRRRRLTRAVHRVVAAGATAPVDESDRGTGPVGPRGSR